MVSKGEKTADEKEWMKKRRCSLCKRQVDEYITIQKIGGRIYLCHDCWMKSKLFVHHFTSITKSDNRKSKVEKVTEEE
jgi:hypothetical protein